jgi:regulator of sigma E protease
MQFLETILYFVITLGVLVFVHEFGHFLAAKLSGMRVDRFSIGFPPRAFGKKIGETDYCVSWIPIGGYVKIAGMIDESFDTDFVDKPPEPWEFRAKPIWQRMLVISGGVLMNLLLAIVIFWAVNYVQGRTIRETTEIGYVLETGPAAKAGVRVGDKILRINNTEITHWEQILSEVFVETIGKDVTLSILRDGRETSIVIPRSSIPDTGQPPLGILPPFTSILVSTVDPGMPADRAGLKPLDVLLSINGTPLHTDTNVKDLVRQNAEKPVPLEWKRGDHVMTATITPTADGRIGIGFGLRYNGPQRTLQYSLLEAFPQGLKECLSASTLFVRQVWQIIIGEVAFAQSVGGPIRIAQLATQTAEAGIIMYLNFMALLSISLAILNFLPFPVLDGGHMVFLVYEAIFRKEVPLKVRLGLQRAGLVLLLAFMAFVLYNDIRHF